MVLKYPTLQDSLPEQRINDVSSPNQIRETLFSVSYSLALFPIVYGNSMTALAMLHKLEFYKS